MKHETLTYRVIYQQPEGQGTHITLKGVLSMMQTFLCMLVCVQALAWL
jgi:hypothetical protein